MAGKSFLKAIMANATTHFASCCRKYCIQLGADKKDSSRVVKDAFLGRWDRAPKGAPPGHPSAERGVNYDMKKYPSKYVEAMYRICSGQGRWHLLCSIVKELRPLHAIKMDTETLAEIFVPHKKAWKAAGSSNRLHYNDWVWG